MPLYEYQCDACGRQFELIRKFSDPPLDTCPTCGGPVRKLMSSPAFQFKGSGFYITDYPKKDQAREAKSDEGKTESAAKDAAKGEKTEKAEKSDKGDKSDKSDRGDKTEKSKASNVKSEASDRPSHNQT